jgi:hypothetical protein
MLKPFEWILTGLVLVAVLAASVPPSARAQSPSQRDVLAPEPETGTRLRQFAGRAGLYPLNKRYEQFTAEERAAFKSMWESMPEADEPPFPAAGMRGLVLELQEALRVRQSPGMLTMVAHVSSEGAVTKVDIHATPDAQLARYMAAKVIRTPFKPAVCGGKPCAMQFPFEFTLRLQ